jgi:hypothetical protein
MPFTQLPAWHESAKAAQSACFTQEPGSPLLDELMAAVLLALDALLAIEPPPLPLSAEETH